MYILLAKYSKHTVATIILNYQLSLNAHKPSQFTSQHTHTHTHARTHTHTHTHTQSEHIPIFLFRNKLQNHHFSYKFELYVKYT